MLSCLLRVGRVRRHSRHMTGQAAHSKLCMPPQREGDETMPQIAEQQEVLSCMLDPLCGISAEKDEDDTVRENLAEAVLLLVRPPSGAPTCSHHPAEACVDVCL